MQKMTIHLTGAPPIEILDEEWPVVARLLWADTDDTGQAKERAYVRVRRNADGRHIVYGLREGAERAVRGGHVARNHREVTEAIHNTCALVGLDPIGLFFDMPAVHA